MESDSWRSLLDAENLTYTHATLLSTHNWHVSYFRLSDENIGELASSMVCMNLEEAPKNIDVVTTPDYSAMRHGAESVFV